MRELPESFENLTSLVELRLEDNPNLAVSPPFWILFEP